MIARIKQYLSKHTAYVLGVALGVALIIINAYIGLSMITLLLDEQERIASVPGLSLPVIKEGDYAAAKEEYAKRNKKVLLNVQGVDPFRLK